MQTLTKPPGTLMVAVLDQAVWIKISGRANFTSSIDLKQVVNELWDRGYRRFVFEISNCVLMDSTFLGVMAGIGLKFAEANQRGEICSVEIANPNERIADLLENLGVAHLFKIVSAEHHANEKFEPLSPNESAVPRVEVTRNCLEAHEILMGLNPENVGKFKDVAIFLAEDLKKLEQAKGK